MRSVALSAAFACAFASCAFGWGQEGHSIVAEIAQMRLSPEAAAMVDQVLGKGRSLASISSWADDAREERPETSNWHFVDIPVAEDSYEPARDCANDPNRGDCVVAELDRLKNDLRCASGEKKAEALKFAVHFLGDIHQPLHTVLENRGGNTIQVDIFTHGLTCTGTCRPAHTHTNFHSAWDSGLIDKTVWSWGAYVERLENGWLKSPEAQQALNEASPAAWAVETHKAAQVMWNLLPPNKTIDDDYYKQALPVLDRQLGQGGLRLARFLNDAYASDQCPIR